jgi:hypothetical protein
MKSRNEEGQNRGYQKAEAKLRKELSESARIFQMPEKQRLPRIM